MKRAVLLAVVAVAVMKVTAAPPLRPVTIIRSKQVNPDELGIHSSDFEADNGIIFHFSGKQGVAGGSNMVGSWSYPQKDGSVASVQFVADENGFQPQSDLLPVAPAFPHPIPQFVLDQIAFAEEETKSKAEDDVD